MEKLKIKQIKNLKRMKIVYNFICSQIKKDKLKFGGEIPLHELYEAMLENLYLRKSYQFYAILNKEIVGAVVLCPLKENPECLEIKIIGTDEKKRGIGIASALHDHIERLATIFGYKSVKALCYGDSHNFFMHKNYSLFFEVIMPKATSTVDLAKFTRLLNEKCQSTNFESKTFVHYPFDHKDNLLSLKFEKSHPNIKSSFICEKHLQ